MCHFIYYVNIIIKSLNILFQSKNYQYYYIEYINYKLCNIYI